MNWYKESQTDHMDLLMNFYNYLIDSNYRRENLELEIPFLYRIHGETPRHKSTKELVQAVLGELTIRFQNILAIPKDFFDYYSKGQTYYRSPVDELITQIQKAEEAINDVNIKRKTLNYDSKYDVYEFQKSVKKLNMELLKLYRALKHIIVENNNLGKNVPVQEFHQFNIHGEPTYKEVKKDEEPAWGYGWKIQNPSTGKWEWWKSNWDSSD